MKDDNKSTSKCKEIVNSIAFHLAEASGAASGTFCPTPLAFQNATQRMALSIRRGNLRRSACAGRSLQLEARKQPGWYGRESIRWQMECWGVFAAHAYSSAPGLAFPLNGLANADPRKGKRKMCRSPVAPLISKMLIDYAAVECVEGDRTVILNIPIVHAAEVTAVLAHQNAFCIFGLAILRIICIAVRDFAV